MKRLLRATRVVLLVALPLLVLIAVVWPWPAPAVDWQTPVQAALRKADCSTAVTYLDAAVRAGSIEAIEMRANVAGGTNCYSDQLPLPSPETRKLILSAYRTGRDYAESLSMYQLDNPDLDPWTAAYASAAVRICALPYNRVHNVDNAGLSEVVPGEPGLIRAFHQQRRHLCVRILEATARSLIGSGDRASRDVALGILRGSPSYHDPNSAVALANLVLVDGFVSRNDTPDRPDRDLSRDTAWSALDLAARAGNTTAAQMMAELLHEGRFHAVDNKQAFYWVLRLRRLGISMGELDITIEHALTETDRSYIAAREANDWSRDAISGEARTKRPLLGH